MRGLLWLEWAGQFSDSFMLDLKNWFNKKHYFRLWNVGPPGALITGLFIYIVLYVDKKLTFFSVNVNDFWIRILLWIVIIEALFILFWILFSLPPTERGRKLSQVGIYKFIRHPVYTVIIYHTPIIFSLLNKSILLMVTIPLIHFFWSKIIVFEESYLVGIFGDKYLEYAKKTPRFFPKIF